MIEIPLRPGAVLFIFAMGFVIAAFSYANLVSEPTNRELIGDWENGTREVSISAFDDDREPALVMTDSQLGNGILVGRRGAFLFWYRDCRLSCGIDIAKWFGAIKLTLMKPERGEEWDSRCPSGSFSRK